MITKFYIIRNVSKSRTGIVLGVCGNNRWLIRGARKIKERAEDLSYVFSQHFRYYPDGISILDADECYSYLSQAGELP